MEEGVIVDAVMVRDELDLLEARLTEYAPFVDLFVVIEGDRQFGNGADKPYHVTDNPERFAPWVDSIEVVRHRVTANDAWKREHEQRRALHQVVEQCAGDDLILWGDVDEFWPVDVLARDIRTPLTIDNRHMVFAPNLEHPKREFGTVIMRADQMADPQDARTGRNHHRRIPGGFHFSWMPHNLTDKVLATAHTEVVGMDVEAGRRHKVTPWDGQRLDVVNVDSSWPIWFRDGSCPKWWFM